MQRKKCLTEGHAWFWGPEDPYMYCRRMFCFATAVSPWVEAHAAKELYLAIPTDRRPRRAL